MAVFRWRRALNKVAATLGSGPVVAQVPGQVAANLATVGTEEAQKSASFVGEELSSSDDEESATALDGQEEPAAALEDEGAGPAAAGLRQRRIGRCSGTSAAALEDRRHAVVVSKICGRWLIQSAALRETPSTQ